MAEAQVRQFYYSPNLLATSSASPSFVHLLKRTAAGQPTGNEEGASGFETVRPAEGCMQYRG